MKFKIGDIVRAKSDFHNMNTPRRVNRIMPVKYSHRVKTILLSQRNGLRSVGYKEQDLEFTDDMVVVMARRQERKENKRNERLQNKHPKEMRYVGPSKQGSPQRKNRSVRNV